MKYPTREPMFAMKFLRLLANSGGAMAVGVEGVALLSVIATQEDACRYSHAVNFWNHQLAAMVGLRDERALRTVRDRCVRAGWLAYEQGSKSAPASYFCLNPASVSDCPDYTSSEVSRNTGNNALLSGQNQPLSGQNVSTSIPIPDPIPSPVKQPSHCDILTAQMKHQSLHHQPTPKRAMPSSPMGTRWPRSAASWAVSIKRMRTYQYGRTSLTSMVGKQCVTQLRK